MKITFKSFVVELLLNLLIFSALTILFVLIFISRTEWDKILPDFFSGLGIIAVWLIFSVLLYHLVLKKIFLSGQYKTALIFFLLLFFSIYIVDTALLNITIYFRGELDHVFFYTPSFWMRFVMILSYSIAYSFIRGYAVMREQRLRLQKENADSKLHQLRSQIEPHFIFNALNNIYALSLEENAVKTASSIEELSGLFRYTLKESKAEKVPVADELEFIERYIHLHSIRLQENKNIQLQTNINWDKKPATIAPLLIINFIENAFKYGVSVEQPSVIFINVQVKDSAMHLTVKNSIHENSKALQNGLGLENTRKRLDLLYAGKYQLKEIKEEAIHEIDLTINLS